ncbi:conserved hypothetical protein [Ricinus communis]|uniref:Trichome birefringence-like N-terminal domain-containing protein n=1 Tax=Ricinus communis TaxID=3988 RepID=B9SGK3_RICCO|nr:conserved hypothetical protein [Ricinus communis]
MDTTSTINKTWSLCAFTSFIGCIFLVLSLNHGQDRLNLSAVQKIAISIASSTPTYSIESLEPENFSESKNLVNEKEVKCNIFDGNWVYDPETIPVYTASLCSFLSDKVSCQRNGRPDSGYEKWTWEAKGCNIPRRSVYKVFKATIRVSRIFTRVLLEPIFSPTQWKQANGSRILRLDKLSPSAEVERS